MRRLLAALADAERKDERAALLARIGEAGREELGMTHAKARQLGLPVSGPLPGGGRFQLRRFENDRPVYVRSAMVNAAVTTATDEVRDSSRFGFANFAIATRIGLWEPDGVPRLSHREFSGRVTVKDGTTTQDDHATRVAGVICATGLFDAELKGMAPLAPIMAYDAALDIGEFCAAAAASADTLSELDQIRISNHSYGATAGWDDENRWWGSFSNNGFAGDDVEGDFGRYDRDASEFDAAVLAQPYTLPFWASGNERWDAAPEPGEAWTHAGGGTHVYDPAQHPPGDGRYKDGFDTLPPAQVAKNVMTVGSVSDAVGAGGVRNVAAAALSPFSSMGPADDGRIKPDIVANGERVVTTDAAGDSAKVESLGTSLACPNASGSAALLSRYYEDRFSELIRASTLKGLIIHTADDLGNPGPDYQHGWGLMNTHAAAEHLKRHADDAGFSGLREGELTDGNDADEFALVWNGTDPIRVTLCWTDPPGGIDAGHDDRSRDLVHDLDLTVVSPGGRSHLPYVMPYVGDWTDARLDAPAVTGVNTVDNVEQVYIASPGEPGVYTVRINHSGLLSRGSQAYSLILSGQTIPGPSFALESPRGQQLVPGEDTVDLGSVVFDTVGPPREFRLVNRGSVPLDILGVFVGGFDAPDFRLDTSTLPGRLAPGEAASFTVSLFGDRAFDALQRRREAYLQASVGAPGFSESVTIDLAGSGASLGQYVPAEFFKASNPDRFDSFGSAVALSGDLLVVGAPFEDSAATGVDAGQGNAPLRFPSSPGFDFDSGAAYVFRRGADGKWVQEAYLKAHNATAGDQFGAAVAISGDTIVVGAPWEQGAGTGVNPPSEPPATSARGAAYVFVRGVGGEWTQQAYLKSNYNPVPDAGDQNFGEAVAIDGDVIVVGDSYETSDATGIDGNPTRILWATWSGAAHVFERSFGAWRPAAYLKASNTDAEDRFGSAVAVSGETVVIGAPEEDSWSRMVNGDQSNNPFGINSGAAYVFRKGPGGWQQSAILKASNAGGDDRFGAAVAIWQDRILIGAPHEDADQNVVFWPDFEGRLDGARDSGAVYAFQWIGGAWSEEEFYLKAPDNEPDAKFGSAVALHGNLAVVGARDYTDEYYHSGHAYVFEKSSNTWLNRGQIEATAPGEDDGFGARVAVHGEEVAVGAPFENSEARGVGGSPFDNLRFRSGAAYLFRPLELIDPEVTLEDGEGTALNDGASSVLFGTGERYPAVRTFLVRNEGSTDLRNVAVTIDGPHAEEYELLTAPVSVVVPGASTFFMVGFTGGEQDGPRLAALHLSSNDLDEGSFDVTLVGIDTAGGPAFFEDFDPPTGAVTGGSVVTVINPADPGSATNRLSLQPAQEALFGPLDTRGGGYVAFELVMLGAAGAGREVVVEAAVDGQNFVPLGPGQVSFVLERIVIPIPPEGRGALTRFRIRQRGSALTSADRWQLDEIEVFTVPVPGPEIDLVFANGAALVDGVSTVRFLPAFVAVSEAIAIFVRNCGDGDLTGLHFMLEGLHASDFEVTSTPGTLLPGARAEFTIRFTPSGPGTRTASLRIASNDLDENPFDLALSGTGRLTPTEFHDDFDPDYDPQLWTEFSEIVAATTSGQQGGPGSAGNSLWFGGVGSRFATTVPVDTRSGGVLSFLLAMGNQTGISLEWDVPEPGDEVVVEYSTDGAAFVQLGGPYLPASWTEIALPLPSAAQASTTWIRFRQLDNGGHAADHWAIEDVAFGPFAPPDLAVEGTDGTVLVSAHSELDFGRVVAAAGSASLSVRLANEGGSDLIGLGLRLGGADAGDFFFVAPDLNVLRPGEDAAVQLHFAPASPGPKSAVLEIVSNDPDEAVFQIALVGVSLSPHEAFEAELAAAGLTGSSADLDATPFSDGVTNLEKYGFNLALSSRDQHRLTPGGNSGLPVLWIDRSGPTPEWRLQFVRRLESGILYHAETSSTLKPGSWSTLAGPAAVQQIAPGWERVTYQGPLAPERSGQFRILLSLASSP